MRLQSARSRLMRRAYPIHAYVGANGSGKSACMAFDVVPTLLAGRPVLSTVRLLDFENPRPCDDPSCTHPEHAGSLLPVPGSGETTTDTHGLSLAVPDAPLITHQAAHPLWIPFTDWEQLLDAERCDVLMDEVTGVASSRESAAMPAPVANKLVQLRRADVTVRWSAPNWARADKIIRETSQAVTYCRGYMAKADADSDRMWRNRRLFKWATYDAADFEEFTAGKREQLRPLVREFHWGPGSVAFDVYDTFDSVLSIGTVTDSGRCYRCGGRREVPRCRCGKHDESPADTPEPRAGKAEGRARGAGARPEPDGGPSRLFGT